MKALSVHPLYATMIAAGEKKIEFRSWKTEFRGPLLICSSQFNDGPYYPRGYALCLANLSDIGGTKGAYQWHLSEVAPVDPFPIKGRQRLFDVPDGNITVLYKGVSNQFLDFDTAYGLWVSRGLCIDAD